MTARHLLTEAGDFLTTESGNRIILEQSAPDVVTEPSQGMGPGWNLCHPPRPQREPNRAREEIEAELIAAFDIASGAETHKERKEAVRELKSAAREFVREAGPERAQAAQELDRLMRVQMGADRLLKTMGEFIAREMAQSNDDEEAFLILMASV